jgi:hypothetical protein
LLTDISFALDAESNLKKQQNDKNDTPYGCHFFAVDEIQIVKRSGYSLSLQIFVIIEAPQPA